MPSPSHPPLLPERLATEHFTMARLAATDAAALLVHFGDPEVTRYLDIDPLTDLADALGIIAWTGRIAAAGTGARWAIRTRDGAAWVGTAGFNAVVRERASRGEIAYDLGREWWGRGVMREVMPALLRAGFVDLDLNRLEAFVTPGNERSSRLLARHGFRHEGLLRQYGRWRARDWDQEILGPAARGMVAPRARRGRARVNATGRTMRTGVARATADHPAPAWDEAAMDVFEALATRRTAGTFGPGCPPRATVERLIEAATWAPNHRMTQPWRFVILAGDERARFGERLAAWLESDAAPADVTPRFIESTRKKPLRSPIVIAVVQRGTPDNPEIDREDYAACCCATENLLLAAHAEGLAARWSTSEMATMPPALEYLGVGEHDRVVAYIYVGYPPEGGAPKRAERPAPVVDWRGFEE